MASINEIILRNTNPFSDIDSVISWHKQEQSESTVDYIHQEAFVTIEALLNQVIQDHRTRTVLINCHSGSGKTYLLTRLRKQFHFKSYFAYIPPFPDREWIWRHILRYTVDSLTQPSEDSRESQLLTWLSAMKQSNTKERMFRDELLEFWRSDKQKFINKLKEIYKQVNIYDPDTFFGILFDLTNSELYPLACSYLRGDDLSEESMQALGIKKTIDTETIARETLVNLGKVAGDNQPIVLCFDQIESIGCLPDGSIDLPALFTVNTKIRDEDHNFLIIINISNHTWEENESKINQIQQSRINQKVDLLNITLAQAELITSSKLATIHSQSNPQPPSPIYPLTRQILEKEFPEGRTNPRDLIIWASNIFKAYKKWLAQGNKRGDFNINKDNQSLEEEHLELLANFKVKWRERFTKFQYDITRINQLSSPELIQILNEALIASGITKITNPLFIRTKYAGYSLGYELPNKSEMLGVVWTEDPNNISLFYVMEACRKMLEKNKSIKMYLIRAESLGSPGHKGYEAYEEIFTNSRHVHIIPNLNSVHYLLTYNSFIRDARERDLVIGGKMIDLVGLQSLINETKILHDCALLQSLGVVTKPPELFESDSQIGAKDAFKPMKSKKELVDSKDYILNLVATQYFLSRQILIQNTCIHFPELKESQIDGLVQQLCWEKKVKIIGHKAPPESQLVCIFQEG